MTALDLLINLSGGLFGALMGSCTIYWLLYTERLDKIADCLGKIPKRLVGGFNRLLHPEVGGEASHEGSDKAAEDVSKEVINRFGDVHEPDANPWPPIFTRLPARWLRSRHEVAQRREQGK